VIRFTLISAALTLSSLAELPTKGVDLKLISAVKTISPNSTFTVGLQIHHHSGFHTYWKNPGAVGYPTTIEWKLPPGFTAGPIRWPAPEMSDMAGNPVFGYESDATLLIDLTAPAELPDEPSEIRAVVMWMACSNECYPGNKTFTLSLPSTESSVIDPANTAAFSAAEKQIPQALKDWTASVESKQDEKQISLLLNPPADLSDIGAFRFYSSDGQISSDPDPEITKLDDGRLRITAKRARFSPKNATSLPFVIVAEKPLSANGPNFGTLSPQYPDQATEKNSPTP